MSNFHGRHIVIVGFGAPVLLGQQDVVRSLLTKLIDAVGMRMLGEPQLYEVAIEISKMGQTPFEDEGGITGTAVLSTSHVAVHTWPVRGYAVLDMYSCRDFDCGVVEQIIHRNFALYASRTTDVSHALTPPPSPILTVR